MKSSRPFFEVLAQSKTLWISVTASRPRGATSPPVRMAYSRPELRARPFANMVLPVPGGPYNRRWRNGALFRLVFEVLVATRLSLSASLGSNTTPDSASLASVDAMIRFMVATGDLRSASTDERDVSRTRLGLPSRASTYRPATPVPTLAEYTPSAMADKVATAAAIFSLSERKARAPSPRVEPASLIPSSTVCRCSEASSLACSSLRSWLSRSCLILPLVSSSTLLSSVSCLSLASCSMFLRFNAAWRSASSSCRLISCSCSCFFAFSCPTNRSRSSRSLYLATSLWCSVLAPSVRRCSSASLPTRSTASWSW
mmetsp:Transcript_81302/g.230759  ORF Transcript_81302/g.230759 Transcript_81302/m.230759 type:complete len:314 (+) Transcript_81302:951-1892(+)